MIITITIRLMPHNTYNQPFLTNLYNMHTSYIFTSEVIVVYTKKKINVRNELLQAYNSD